jgi:uncharacterized membrane protein
MRSFPKRPKAYAFFAVVGIAYPLLVYIGLHYFSASVLAAGMLALFGLRLICMPGTGARRTLTYVWGIAAGGLLLGMALSPLAGLKSYPIIVSLGLAAIFGYSLLRPPTIVERIALLHRPDLPPSAIPYLRKVTIAWLAFLVLNAGLSLWTALSGSLELWTLYNGLISYLLMGLLFGVEFSIRHFLERRHGGMA